MPIKSFLKDRIINHRTESILNLSSAAIYDEDVDELVQMINANSFICRLDLSQTNIGDDAIAALCNMKNVISLKLSLCNVQNNGASILINHPQFLSLDLSKNKGINDNIGILTLENAKQVYLNLDQTSISSEYIKKLNIVISENFNRLKEIKSKQSLDRLNKLINKHQLFNGVEVEKKDLPNSYYVKPKP